MSVNYTFYFIYLTYIVILSGTHAKKEKRKTKIRDKYFDLINVLKSADECFSFYFFYNFFRK